MGRTISFIFLFKAHIKPRYWDEAYLVSSVSSVEIPISLLDIWDSFKEVYCGDLPLLWYLWADVSLLYLSPSTLGPAGPNFSTFCTATDTPGSHFLWVLSAVSWSLPQARHRDPGWFHLFFQGCCRLLVKLLRQCFFFYDLPIYLIWTIKTLQSWVLFV